MKVKVSELSGPALDWAVARIEGVPVRREFSGDDGHGNSVVWLSYECLEYSPSKDWAQGGPLIEHYDPEERRLPERDRYAEIWLDRSGGCAVVGRGVGDTRLVAFCRALVDAQLGSEIEIPDELLTPA